MYVSQIVDHFFFVFLVLHWGCAASVGRKLCAATAALRICDAREGVMRARACGERLFVSGGHCLLLVQVRSPALCSREVGMPRPLVVEGIVECLLPLLQYCAVNGGEEMGRNGAN
ncbi:hypothetical protein F5Y15DRAFT_144703 [Xylariaceae sp. FL0016]|nr:hypothetical protein F5Y15DRAFT_144703 [Xylariaceae sp. FL0016]